MRSGLGIAGLSLALVSGLALTPKPDGTLASCYRLRLGVWSTGNPGPESMPLVIRFDTVGAAGAHAKGFLSPNINTQERNLGTWETFDGDSIRFGWTEERGISSIQIRAKIMGDSLAGVVSSVTFEEHSVFAPATAYRTGCPKHLQ